MSTGVSATAAAAASAAGTELSIDGAILLVAAASDASVIVFFE